MVVKRQRRRRRQMMKRAPRTRRTKKRHLAAKSPSSMAALRVKRPRQNKMATEKRTTSQMITQRKRKKVKLRQKRRQRAKPLNLGKKMTTKSQNKLLVTQVKAVNRKTSQEYEIKRKRTIFLFYFIRTKKIDNFACGYFHKKFQQLVCR